MAILLSSLKSKLSSNRVRKTAPLAQTSRPNTKYQTPNTKNNANHQRFMHGMVAMRIILALSFTGRASCVRTRATYMHAAAVKKSRGIQLHRWQSCVSLLLILMTHPSPAKKRKRQRCLLPPTKENKQLRKMRERGMSNQEMLRRGCSNQVVNGGCV